MIIKEKFTLLRNIPNLLNVPASTINSYEIESDSARRAFILLELHKGRITHFLKDKIFDILSNPKKRENIKIVIFDEYILPITFNKTSGDIIINLKPFDVDELAKLNPRTLYACIVYGHCFSQLVTGKKRISDNYAAVIVNYLLSVMVRLFGKEYGLLGAYASNIPLLKFLLACYIMGSFFGFSGKNLYSKAYGIAPFNYKEIEVELDRYDFSDVSAFIKSLNELNVMPSLSAYQFTAKFLRFLGLNFIPAVEDCSRFISSIIVSDIGGGGILPAHVKTYNANEYEKILSLARTLF